MVEDIVLYGANDLGVGGTAAEREDQWVRHEEALEPVQHRHVEYPLYTQSEPCICAPDDRTHRTAGNRHSHRHSPSHNSNRYEGKEIHLFFLLRVLLYSRRGAFRSDTCAKSLPGYLG
jgi:hypothetical protein